MLRTDETKKEKKRGKNIEMVLKKTADKNQARQQQKVVILYR